MKGSFTNKCGMHWNVNLKELDKNLRSWSSSQYFQKNKKKPFHLGCKVVKAKMVLEDVGVGKK